MSGYGSSSGHGGTGYANTTNSLSSGRSGGYGHPQGDKIGAMQGRGQNLQNSANTTQQRYREEKPYPMHSKVQIAVNMLQKLHAMGSDFAQNQKNMDFSDSDFRMLPLRMAGIAATYTFAIKLAFLGILLSSVPVVYFNVPIWAVGLTLTVIFWLAFNFPSTIIRNSLQYVTGTKTKRYYQKMLLGWRVFEFMFLLMVFVSIALFYLKDHALVSHGLEKLLAMKLVAKTSLSIETFHGAIKATMFLMLSLFGSHIFFNTASYFRAKKLQKDNLRSMTVENRREEVADKILDGSF